MLKKILFTLYILFTTFQFGMSQNHIYHEPIMLQPIDTVAYKIALVDTVFINSTPLILTEGFVWDTNAVSSTTTGFKLQLKNHSFIEFADTESTSNSGVRFTKHNYFMGTDKDKHYSLVAGHTYISWDYYLINTANGKIDTVNNIPKFSPDGKFYVVLAGSAMGRISGFITIKNLETGFIISLSYNDIMPQFIGWENSNSFLFYATDRKAVYKKYYQFTIKD